AKINLLRRSSAIHQNDDKGEGDKRDEKITVDQNAEDDERERSPAGYEPPVRMSLAVLVLVRRPRQERGIAFIEGHVRRGRRCYMRTPLVASLRR
ncbi:MAG: hypothetical protein WAP52_01025, partial [Candidatus Sungiibacteriota bacterium]